MTKVPESSNGLESMLLDDSRSEIPTLLNQFQSFFSISPQRIPVPTSKDSSVLPTTAALTPKCIEFITLVVNSKEQITDDVMKLIMKTLAVLTDNDDISDQIMKLQDELILKLINIKRYTDSLTVIRSVFIQLHNLMSKTRIEDGEVPIERLLHGLYFNVFNVNYAKHITTLYILINKLVIESKRNDEQVISTQHYLAIFNSNLYQWFNCLEEKIKKTKIDIMKKNLITFSNDCKSIWKLNFLIKAMWFSTLEEDLPLIKHTSSVLEKLVKVDEKLTYQYTSSNFIEFLKYRKPHSKRIEKLASIYHRIQLKNPEFQNDDINWVKYINEDTFDITITMDQFLNLPNESIDELLNIFNEDVDWDKKDIVTKLIKCTIKSIKLDDEDKIMQILLPSLQIISNSDITLETEFMLQFLDYITNFCRSAKFTLLLNDIFKNLSSLYKRFNRIDKYCNLSNICFQNGGKLLLQDFKESLNQWMNCVNYDYNVFMSNINTENFQNFQQKVERIANLLISNKKYHESKIFLMKNFECYMKLTHPKDFIQLESKFQNDLAISLKLLTKTLVLSKSMNLLDLDSILQALITGGILDIVSSFTIDGKTIIINDMMENLKRKLQDHGLFQYVLIKYYNLVGLDSFIHINYKDFNEKKFPAESCMYHYKELIICSNYLQYTVNRALNQTIVVRCIELFQKWLQLKPNSILNNHETLFHLEWDFCKTFINYLNYQHLYINSIKLIRDYTTLRSPILSTQQLENLNCWHAMLLNDLRFFKQSAKFLKIENKRHSIDKRLIKLELDIENKATVDDDYQELLSMLQQKENSIHEPSTSRKLKLENLCQFVQFSYLSAIYKFHRNDPVNAIMDFRRAVRMGKMILSKYLLQLSNITMNEFNALKWRVSSNLIKSLLFGMKLTMHCGLTKHSLYYLEELLTFVDAQQLPLVKCYCYYDIAEFYLLSKNYIKSNEFMIKSDDIYNTLAFDDNLLELKGLAAHSFYFRMIGDWKNEKTYLEKLELFYKDLHNGKLNNELTKLINDDPQFLNNFNMEIEYKRYFKMQNIDHSSESMKRIFNTHPYTSIIKAKKHSTTGKKLLQSDPVLSGLDESPIAIPATMSSANGTSIVRRLLIEFANSETMLKSSLVNQWQKLSVLEMHDLSKSLDEILSYKSAISMPVDYADDLYNLGEVPRYLPFTFEKQLLAKDEPLSQLLPQLTLSNIELPKNVYERLRLVLPKSWLVVTLDICPIKGDLIITRFDKQSQSPMMVRLPLVRHYAVDSDETFLTFEDAMKELQRIIDESNATTKAKRVLEITTREDKLKWWDERKLLDKELDQLLSKIELHWIGGFKGLFNQLKINLNLKLEFKQKFDIILNQYLPSRFNKKSKNNNKIEIDDQILELLFLNLSLPLQSTDLLEDLIYFLLDTLLYHGEENSSDEVDIDHMYIDIEELLTKYHEQNILREFNKFDHTMLIVGKNCCNFPWESLPYLRKFSMSRLPSLQMLCDLLERDTNELHISKSKGSYIINPNGDLPRTETNFKTAFSRMPGWDGMVGVRPTEEQFSNAISGTNLFIYIGHGSGDQYIRSNTIKSIKNCSAALLIGCSSGILHDNGAFEPYGTIYNYLIAGSPMVLVNMWDVTDKDIDKFTISVFDKWGLFNDSKHQNIAQLVSMSRDDCNLKFLNGAAPILYGLPLKLSK